MFLLIDCSLFIDVNHAERCCLIGLALVLDGEDHDFIAGEAVGLLFGDLEDERNQLLHVLLCIAHNSLTHRKRQVSHTDEE